jgi:hypothetical protein
MESSGVQGYANPNTIEFQFRLKQNMASLQRYGHGQMYNSWPTNVGRSFAS